MDFFNVQLHHRGAVVVMIVW